MRIMLATGAAMLALLASAATPPPERDLGLSMARTNAFCGPRNQGARLAYFLSIAEAYAEASPAAAANAPPLMRGLGDAHVTITTASPRAQAYFDQGVRLTHNFNHLEAIRAFKAAQAADPACAMCYWGEAFALGPNINAPMDVNDNPAAFAAARAALANMEHATDVEKALIEAIQVRYVRNAPPSRSGLDGAFADAMGAVADQFPDNDFVQTLAAEAAMDTQPWDYWETDGQTPKGRAADMVRRVETVLARSPNYAGAIHLYIHLVEASADPWRAEAPAERLARLTPNSGHLVHMPGHIYYRIGRMRDSIRTNINAVAVDEAYLRANEASPIYQYGYYTHNVHFVMASAMMGGDSATALSYADRLDRALPMEMAAVVPISQPVKAAVWYARAMFAPPQSVLTAPAPPAGVDFVTGSWRFARGLAEIRAGRAERARAEAEEIGELQVHGDFSALNEQGVPAQDVLDIYRRVLVGKSLLLERDYAAGIAELEAAALAQARIPYTEPPYIYYPVRRSLGGAYLLAGQPALAENQFLQTLTESPNDAYALWGLAEARRMRGDGRGRSAARALFQGAFLGRTDSVTAMAL